MDGPPAMCGNGVVEGTEQCDEGDANGGEASPCTAQCTWTCIDDSWCTDNEPCNGVETCVDHACVKGTNEPDGTSCGDAEVCRNGACTDAVCGDMFVTAPEECDDANPTPGDGCENDCTYSCVSTDATRNCTPADECQGQGTCDDTTHTCTPGTPLADNTPCGSGGYCKAGTCTQPMCDNGITELGEQCDLGASNGVPGSGCKDDCTFECVDPATDCPAAPACNMQTCNAAHACQAVADSAQNGMTCGTDLVCSDGACVTPTAVCGNGVTETGEDCDFGSGNGPGTGCESNCKFSCTVLPDSCNDGNACNGTETCTMVTVGGHDGQKCTSTAPPAEGTSCATGKICVDELCVNSSCGDGFVDSSSGEQCEPPNTATCSSTCTNIVCGDGVRAGAEQCDDGNTRNLDGCDSSCKFEQCHRANSLAMEFGTAFCMDNALGSAVADLAQDMLNQALADGVADGSITIELLALGLDDLSGTNDPSLSLGILTGTPVAGSNYDGTMDLDWWYTTASTVIDASRVPKTQMTASISAKNLTAGPSDISITISLAGTLATLNMVGATIKGNIGATSTPTTSTGSTPGHLASEHLDPTLQSFRAMGNGQLCGDVTAGSLAQVPIPSVLESNCAQYNSTNSLLDVIVGGCKALGIIPVINKTQPDKTRSGTGRYTLVADPVNYRVTGCRDQANQVVPLATCMSDALYSASFAFTTDRVIAK